MPPSAKPRVFISYSHKDGATLARRLKKDLRDKEFDVWLDTQRVKGGSSWSNEIEQEIDRSDIVLALLSAGSFESNVWGSRERPLSVLPGLGVVVAARVSSARRNAP